jgi:hypothetical protein
MGYRYHKREKAGIGKLVARDGFAQGVVAFFCPSNNGVFVSAYVVLEANTPSVTS